MKSRGGSPAAVTDATLTRSLYQFSVPLLPKGQDADLLTLFEIHNPQGEVVQSFLSSDSTQARPVSVVLKQDVSISKVPGARGLSGLLKAGQTVKLNRVERAGSHLYVQAPAGWILLPDESVHR